MPPTAVHPSIASATSDGATSDRQLVALAARGDQRSFELLFQRHRAGVHAYAVRMLADHAAAEDVVQDVFVSAMRSLRSGTEPIHVRAWLHEIARCACVDQWRGSERRREVSYDAPDSLSGKDARQMAVSGDVAMRGAADRESLACLQSAFEDLSPLQHRVLVQRELEGRSSNEIAERLGISPTVVEGQLARGRRSLAVAFRELQSGERCAATRELCDSSLDRALGVRDRTRVRVHLRTCASCRRHARAAGVEPRLFDPRVLSHLGFLLPIPLLRRFPLSSIFASSESLGVVVTGKALVGAAVIAAGGGSALVMTDVGPGRGSDPAPGTSRPAEQSTAVSAAAPAMPVGGAPATVMASTTLPLGALSGMAGGPQLRVAFASPGDDGSGGRTVARDGERERERDGGAIAGSVSSAADRRDAMTGPVPTPLTLPRFVPAVPPRLQRIVPVPDGAANGGGTEDSGDTTVVVRSGKQLQVVPVAAPAAVEEPVADEPPVEEPLPEPVEEPVPAPIEEPVPEPVEQPVPEPVVETPPADGGDIDPAPVVDPGNTDPAGGPDPAPAVPDPGAAGVTEG